jgi:hypothetical protein
MNSKIGKPVDPHGRSEMACLLPHATNHVGGLTATINAVKEPHGKSAWEAARGCRKVNTYTSEERDLGKCPALRSALLPWVDRVTQP